VRLIVGSAVIGAGLRVPFLFTGLSMDEGGYAYIAQQWSRGARLYDTAWVDRPQGLLLTYRALLWINDSGWTVRLGAVLAGCALTILIGAIAWMIAGRRAGIAAAAMYAVIGVAPHIEGFTLNGELLASVPATAAVAAALMSRRAPGRRWLVVAGLAAGVALTMKQSGIDGIVTGLAVIVTSGGPWRSWAGRAGRFLAASTMPIMACAADGWLLGWSHYWSALVGYQITAMSDSDQGAARRWHEFTAHLPAALRDLALVVVVATIGIRHLSSTSRRIMTAWLVAVAVAVNIGGAYWPHYYIQFLPPLAILSGIAVARLRAGYRQWILAAAAVLPALLWLTLLVPMDAAGLRQAIPYYGLTVRDEHIASAIRAETTPDQQILVIVSEADIYFLAQRVTSYAYLWGMPIEKIPTALGEMRALLAGPSRPTIVVLNTDLDAVDPSGALGRVLATYYHYDTTVDGVRLWRAN
jgi:4-amino-4-deoxy-L-arabinose transferase-like glycosyltransferase